MITSIELYLCFDCQFPLKLGRLNYPIQTVVSTWDSVKLQSADIQLDRLDATLTCSVMDVLPLFVKIKSSVQFEWTGRRFLFAHTLTGTIMWKG